MSISESRVESPLAFELLTRKCEAASTPGFPQNADLYLRVIGAPAPRREDAERPSGRTSGEQFVTDRSDELRALLWNSPLLNLYAECGAQPFRMEIETSWVPGGCTAFLQTSCWLVNPHRNRGPNFCQNATTPAYTAVLHFQFRDVVCQSRADAESGVG
jgi:hypothetical protein